MGDHLVALDTAQGAEAYQQALLLTWIGVLAFLITFAVVLLALDSRWWKELQWRRTKRRVQRSLERPL